MKRITVFLAVLALAAVAVPAGAGRRPLACEAIGTFTYVAIVDPWWPVEIHGTGSCQGDMGGPYTVTIDGSGIIDESGRCAILSNALMDVRVSLTSISTGTTRILDQKWNIYFTGTSSVGSLLIRAPVSGSGVMFTRLFNAIGCLQDQPPVPPYQSVAHLRWAFVR